jgi:hypothetical protein
MANVADGDLRAGIQVRDVFGDLEQAIGVRERSKEVRAWRADYMHSCRRQIE